MSDIRMTFNSLSLHQETGWSKEIRVKKEEHVRKKVPKINTIRKWKAMFPWLDFLDGMKMVCKSCKSQEEKLQLIPGANLTFVTWSTNYHPSMLKNHTQTDGHKWADGEEAHAEAEVSSCTF